MFLFFKKKTLCIESVYVHEYCTDLYFGRKKKFFFLKKHPIKGRFLKLLSMLQFFSKHVYLKYITLSSALSLW